MTVRLMQLADHPQLVRLWKPEQMTHEYDYLKAVLERNPTTCFVKEVDGRIVAATLGLYDGRRGFLQAVAVLPAERNKGYGKAVAQAAVDALLALGTRRVRLFVMKSNTEALKFYHKLGFEIHDFVHYMGLKME